MTIHAIYISPVTGEAFRYVAMRSPKDNPKLLWFLVPADMRQRERHIETRLRCVGATMTREPYSNRERCTRCNEWLHPRRIKYLERNWKTGVYSDPDIKLQPENESQGAFPFGLACARAQLREGKP